MSLAAVTITSSRALSYRVPETLASNTRHINYSVVLTAVSAEGAILEGTGEGQPRGSMTGDSGTRSWTFLTEAVRRLEGVELDTTSVDAAVSAVDELMVSVRAVAQETSRSSTAEHPFSGSMLAVETALLDLVSHALELPLAQVIQRGVLKPLSVDDVSAAEIAGPISGAESTDEFQTEARRAFDWEQEVVPDEEHDELLQALLVLQCAVQRTAQEPTLSSLGIDLDGLLSFRAAKAFVRRVVTAAAQGNLPPRVVLDRVLPRNYRRRTHRLQAEADALLQTAGRRDISVDLRESWKYWDHQTPSRFLQEKSLDSSLIAIRPSQSGGLLAAGRAVQQARSEKQNAFVVLADVPGGTTLSRAALRSLNEANLGQDWLIADTSDASEIPVGGLPEVVGNIGHGARFSYEAIVGDVREMVTYPAPPSPTYEGRPVAVYNDVDHLHPLGPNGSKGHLLERQALAFGLKTTRYSKGAFRAGDDEKAPLIFKWSRNPLSSAASLALCTHKEGTRMQLQRAGIPVPRGRTFLNGDFTAAKQFVERIGYPVVVKPAMGVRGIGVVAGIQNEQELESAFEIMSSSKLGKQDFIVEKHINGRDYRIVVVGDQVIAAIQREPASVFGDGESTVAQLLVQKNVARKRNPHLWARPAKYDAAARYELEKAGLTLSSVPKDGQRVLLANTCSLSQGGDSIDVLDEMHPSIIEACVKTVNAIPQLEYCGVDFLLEDHTKPLDQQDAGICELNAHAAIGNCEYPMFGQGRPVAETVMRAAIDQYDMHASEKPAEHVALHLTIRGKVTGVGYRKWLKRRAQSSGLTGWVKNVNRKTVEAVLVGETVAATAVAAATILGPKSASPTSYDAVHIEDPHLPGFSIHEEPSARVRDLARKVKNQAGKYARRLNLYRPTTTQEENA